VRRKLRRINLSLSPHFLSEARKISHFPVSFAKLHAHTRGRRVAFCGKTEFVNFRGLSFQSALRLIKTFHARMALAITVRLNLP